MTGGGRLLLLLPLLLLLTRRERKLFGAGRLPFVRGGKRRRAERGGGEGDHNHACSGGVTDT